MPATRSGTCATLASLATRTLSERTRVSFLVGACFAVCGCCIYAPFLMKTRTINHATRWKLLINLNKGAALKSVLGNLVYGHGAIFSFRRKVGDQEGLHTIGMLMRRNLVLLGLNHPGLGNESDELRPLPPPLPVEQALDRGLKAPYRCGVLHVLADVGDVRRPGVGQENEKSCRVAPSTALHDPLGALINDLVDLRERHARPGGFQIHRPFIISTTDLTNKCSKGWRDSAGCAAIHCAVNPMRIAPRSSGVRPSNTIVS